MKSMLVIDTPNNCSECELKSSCKVFSKYLDDHIKYNINELEEMNIVNLQTSVLPQCPLQETILRS